MALILWLPPLIAVLGLAYRKTLYLRIPVAPGEPYGLGDIIDGLFGLLLVIACAAVVLASVWQFAHRKNGWWLAASAVLSYAIYFTLH